MDKKDYAEWYLEAVEAAGLSDKRYPIKGMNVWTPYGWKIMSLIDAGTRAEMDATGHDEVRFPLLIPETEFKKEADHIKGFDSEVYWVTHAGENELDVRLVVRPTSETAMYPMFSLWVRSHQDLPLKVYQIVNTFRYETKQTRPFIRVREIHFFEAHTCHADEEDAQRQIEEDLGILERVMRRLCLPYHLLKRTDWDKFPGAHYTVGIDTVMPNGRTLQLGSVHHYRDNFSIPYDITYEGADGKHRHVHQTTYGMSERLLGAIVSVHGDDSGIVLPPAVAPFQAVIVPIPKKGGADEVMDAALGLEAVLREAGIRVKLDARDERPGNKYYYWEARGVPIRLEIGARDIENGVVTFARRDTGEKGTMAADSVVGGVELLMEAISESMREKAWEFQRASVVDIADMGDLPESIVRFGWCGSEGCGLEFEETTELKMLGTPYPGEEYDGKCLVCGKPTKTAAYAARTM
ncbi:MAG: proline--tRNA ligase [Thermoplasmatales archaeon]|nr:proline--tRNA ligase [Thermoplasmatales archaeon]